MLGIYQAVASCPTGQKLEAQEECDESVEALLAGLSSILPLVAIVEKAAKLPRLKSIVGRLLQLIEDDSQFIIEYYTEGQTGMSACFYDNKMLSHNQYRTNGTDSSRFDRSSTSERTVAGATRPEGGIRSRDERADVSGRSAYRFV